ncbi:MAG: methyltransferase domain-containing protein [Synergistaceae bacterium]|jgi:cyclopropane fatty-acyl-phospholipid synthase-like methyltransferase|nr:methyltransferase domain-containing protein [Synergistaceae bacterium]
MKFGKHTEFDKDFYQKNLMGPSSVRIIEELTQHLRLSSGMRILDLGCGTGLTSIFLAKEFGVQVFATDLWIAATDNYERIRAFGLEDRIIPIHADAREQALSKGVRWPSEMDKIVPINAEARGLPFADGYFDAIVSVDAYYYFGTGGDYLDKHIAPLLAKDGFIAVGTPGLQKEFGENVPDEMKPFWTDEVNETFHDAGWWKSLWGQSKNMSVTDCFSLKCHKAAWEDWLECDNPYTRGDVKMMEAEGGRYFDAIGIIAGLKQ